MHLEPLAKITCPESDPQVVIRPFHGTLESENTFATGGKSFGIAKDLGVGPFKEEFIRKLLDERIVHRRVNAALANEQLDFPVEIQGEGFLLNIQQHLLHLIRLQVAR